MFLQTGFYGISGASALLDKEKSLSLGGDKDVPRP